MARTGLSCVMQIGTTVRAATSSAKAKVSCTDLPRSHRIECACLYSWSLARARDAKRWLRREVEYVVRASPTLQCFRFHASRRERRERAYDNANPVTSPVDSPDCLLFSQGPTALPAEGLLSNVNTQQQLGMTKEVKRSLLVQPIQKISASQNRSLKIFHADRAVSELLLGTIHPGCL